jgi:DNA-binding transcriptional MerR regulator
MTIGELSVKSGRSVHALRWYERQGLVPGVERDRGGRRVYTELHVGWFGLMERLQRTGMTVAEMREYTALVKQGHTTLRQRRALLTAHRARVTATIAEWKSALRAIDLKIDFYSRWIATGQRPANRPKEQRHDARRQQTNRQGLLLALRDQRRRRHPGRHGARRDVVDRRKG